MGLSTTYSGIIKVSGKKLITACTIANGALATPISKNEMGTQFAFNRLGTWTMNCKELLDFDINKVVADAKNCGFDFSFFSKNEGSIYQITAFEDYPYNHDLALLFEDIIKVAGGGILNVSTEYDIPKTMSDMTLVGESFIMPVNPTYKEIEEYSLIGKDYGIESDNIHDIVYAMAKFCTTDSRDEMGFLDTMNIQPNFQQMAMLDNAWVDITRWYNSVMNKIYARPIRMINKMNLFNFVAWAICTQNLTATEVSANSVQLGQKYVDYLRTFENVDVNNMMKGLCNVQHIPFTTYGKKIA